MLFLSMKYISNPRFLLSDVSFIKKIRSWSAVALPFIENQQLLAFQEITCCEIYRNRDVDGVFHAQVVANTIANLKNTPLREGKS